MQKGRLVPSGVDASWEIAGTALWRDVLGLHRRTPIHCMVGGGDQLYQDGFFHVSKSFPIGPRLRGLPIDLLSHCQPASSAYG